jgi:hypothetical protein
MDQNCHGCSRPYDQIFGWILEFGSRLIFCPECVEDDAATMTEDELEVFRRERGYPERPKLPYATE